MMLSLRSAIPVAIVALISPLLGQKGYPQGSSRGRYSTPSTGASARGRTSAKPGTLPDEPLASFRGTVQGAGPKILVVKTAAAEAVDFECSKKTNYERSGSKVKAADVKPGDRVAVEARHTIDGKVMAVNVILDPPPGPRPQNPSDIDAHQSDIDEHKLK